MRDPTYTEQCEALIATLRQRLAEVEAERDQLRAGLSEEQWREAFNVELEDNRRLISERDAAMTELRNHAVEVVRLRGRVDRLRAVVEAAREVYSGPEGCVTDPPCGACAWCRLGQRLSALDAQEGEG